MAADAGNSGAVPHADRDQRPDDGDHLTSLLRQSHIFASVVREVLDLGLLREATPLPLTVSQFHLLKLMSLNGHHQLSHVAQFLGVSAPAATKNIDKLERLGLVSRTPSEGDRRATWLAVSPKGRRVVRKYEGLKSARLAPVLQSFPPAKLEELTKLLECFSVSLLSTEAPSGGMCLRCAAYIEQGCPVGKILGGCPYQVARDARAASAGVPGEGHAR